MDTIPEVNPKHTTPVLADHHAEYLKARAVDPGKVGGAFWTARRPSEIPEAFSERMRRGGEALVAAFRSPDRETLGYQIRFDRRRRDRSGKVLKWLSPPAERARIVLGVMEGMLEEVRTGSRPLWVVEGATRGAALERFGIPAVFIPGCWNWQKDGEPLECWEHVNLAGRLVLVAFDADWRTNEKVQMALSALVAFLEDRGARVLVVSVPEINGDDKAGLDDAIAHGADPYALAREARPYERVDVERERLGRNESLRRFVEEKGRETGELPARGSSECNARKVARFLVSRAARRGKMGERGVEVPASLPQIAEGVRLGSYQTVRKALEQLQSVGFLERMEEPRAPREATQYLLFYPWGGGSALGVNIGTREAEEGEGQERRGESEPEQENPHFQRESYLSLHSTQPPALRNSKLVHTYAKRNGRRVVVDSDYYWRYGAKREEIFRYILERAAVDERELWQKFGSATSSFARFLTTWLSPMIEDGVLRVDGALIFPAADWPEALDRVRERTDEERDNRLQSEKYARRKREYLDYLERRRRGEDTRANREPELQGKEAVAETLERQKPRWEAESIEDEREKVGTTAAVFLADEMASARGIRWHELSERWVDQGGKREMLRQAVFSGPYRFHREEVDDYLYVYHAPAAEVLERQREGVETIVHRPSVDSLTPPVSRVAS